VVGWFQSFKTPLLIMAAIPFSLVGILPAHAAMGAFFTATSMIGFIAGAASWCAIRSSWWTSSSCGCARAFPSSRPSSTPARCGSAHGPHRRRHDRRRRVILFDPIFQGWRSR
jgi:hypothetical protein